MSNFGDILSDTQVVVPRSGLEADRPTTGMSPGDTWFSTDTLRGYVTEDGVNWEESPEVEIEARVSALEVKLVELAAYLLEQGIAIPDGLI